MTASDWSEDTTDVLHCSMPPQVRQHIEELRAEVARLTAHAQQVEVPHSSAAVLGYVGVYGPERSVITTDMGTVAAFREAFDTDGDPEYVIAAVVRVGADGRIGS